jgi:serine/threonine protein kinase
MPPRRTSRRRAGDSAWFGKSKLPQPLPYDREAARPGPNQVTAQQQRAWLDSSADWPDLPYPEWRAKRVLGAGTYGICGLWQRFLKAGPQPREIVVKQAHPNNADELKIESTLLKRIRDSTNVSGGTDHIVKLYKEQYRDPGGQSGDGRFDQSPWDLQGNPDPNLDVARMYLEYCQGGDLWHKCLKLPDTPWTEEECWRLLECLANGAVVMDSGTEHPLLAGNIWAQYAPPEAHWARRQIVHFDLKPQNSKYHSDFWLAWLYFFLRAYWGAAELTYCSQY